jgi:FkbM family methyltransferase
MISAMKMLMQAALRHPLFGRAVSATLYKTGALQLARKTAYFSGYKPDPVSIEVRGGGVFSMYTTGDLVATCCWKASYEEFEAPLPAVFCALARHARTIVGVGTNTGLYELMAAATSSATLYAFEPFPPAFEKLKKNVELNHFTSRILLSESALSDKVGVTPMYIPIEHNFPDMVPTNVSINPAFHEKSEIQREISVAVSTLDVFSREHRLPQIDILRIDAEGAEDLVLAGARTVLRESRPFVFVEVLEGRVDHANIERICQELGYFSITLDADAVTVQARLLPVVSSPNQLLCPNEKREKCLQRLRSAGFRVNQ